MAGMDGVIQDAANVKIGSSEKVTAEDVLQYYPQFSEVVPNSFFDMLIDRANQIISQRRWHNARRLAISLYVAHYCTMWLKTSVPDGADARTVLNAGETKGAITSKSVDGVSVSYGSSQGSSDLVGYGDLKDTIYGQQLATMAKLYGAGMMVVR